MNPLAILLSLGSTLIERLFPDPTQAAAAKLELLKLQQSGELASMTAQTDIDKVEAANPNVFVSGWRPFIGWACGAAYAWNWVGLPFTSTLMAIAGHPLNMAPIDASQLTPVLMGMLGLGAYRTYEKIKGVESK